MLSVFITPCAKPTACHFAISRAVRDDDFAQERRVLDPRHSVKCGIELVDHIVGQRLHRLGLSAMGEDLERAEADVARRHANDDAPRLPPIRGTPPGRYRRRTRLAWSGCRGRASPRRPGTRGCSNAGRPGRRRTARTPSCPPPSDAGPIARRPRSSTSPSRIARPSPSCGTHEPN